MCIVGLLRPLCDVWLDMGEKTSSTANDVLMLAE
jgi:hypothetical protein